MSCIVTYFESFIVRYLCLASLLTLSLSSLGICVLYCYLLESCIVTLLSLVS